MPSEMCRDLCDPTWRDSPSNTWRESFQACFQVFSNPFQIPPVVGETVFTCPGILTAPPADQVSECVSTRCHPEVNQLVWLDAAPFLSLTLVTTLSQTQSKMASTCHTLLASSSCNPCLPVRLALSTTSQDEPRRTPHRPAWVAAPGETTSPKESLIRAGWAAAGTTVSEKRAQVAER